MSLAQAYINTPRREVYDTIIVAHFDSHGVATAAARMRLLRQQGQRVAIYSQFPATGPTPQFPQFIDELRSHAEAKVVEFVDIPVNVRSPDLHIDAEARAPGAQIFHYDHHETSVPFAQRLAARGVIPVMSANATQMAAALGLLGDEEVKKLAIVGIVADRDPSILSIVGRDEVERYYIELANKLDVIVRNTRILNVEDQGGVADILAVHGVSILENIVVEYPPYNEINRAVILSEGGIAVLADFEAVAPMWAPKTAEELLRRRGKHYAVFVAPAIDPRSRRQIGWDVRVLQYWLSEYRPEPEEVVRDLVARFAVAGNVVGHGRYVSLRLQGASKDYALNLARQIFQRIEGNIPMVTHLVNDRLVANAVRRDFSVILERLTEILDQQKKMYEEYLQLKRRQVELLEQSEDRRRYD